MPGQCAAGRLEPVDVAGSVPSLSAMIRTCGACGRENRVPAKHLSHKGRCGACKAELAPLAEPVEVDPALFDEVVNGASVPVLVDFWAAWCGPCRMVAPEVEKAAKAMAGKALVLKLNTERHPGVAARFGVQSIPNFVVFSKGRPVRQQAGATDHRRLVRWVEDAA